MGFAGMCVLQAMISCGAPDGMEAFRVVAELLAGEERRATAQSGDGPPHTGHDNRGFEFSTDPRG
jgi:hypothetical protein